jgi:Tfp pilus assembly protein PilO
MKFDLRRYQGQGFFIIASILLVTLTLTLTRLGYFTYTRFADQAVRYQRYHSLQLQAGKADSLSLTYTKVLQDLETVHKALPLENPSSQVLNLLVDGAHLRNLGITGITGLDEIPFPGYKELPFDLSLTGRFIDLTQFLYGLESQGMVLRIRHLNIQSETLNASRILAKVELSVFIPTDSFHKIAL